MFLNDLEVAIRGDSPYNDHDDGMWRFEEDQVSACFLERKEHILYDQKICYRSVV